MVRQRTMWFLVIPVCASLTFAGGCVQMSSLTSAFNQVTPDQKLDKELDIGLVGDITEVGNGGFIQVSGVGLVTGLDGTGGTPPGQYRTMLEQQLRKQKIDNARSLLDSPNNALVLVTAFLPAGVRRGELVDVEITLPKESKATSLKGGILAECPLRNYENRKNLNPEAESSLLAGHILAKAKGPLLVGLGNPEDAIEQRRARIWSGASSLIERPFYFILNKDDMKTAKVANSIAARLNLQFQDDPRKQKIIQDNRDLMLLDDVKQQINRNFEGGFGKGEMAKATGKEVVSVRVPYAYRYNPERFLRVARLLPLTVPQDVMNGYRLKLEKILVEPKHTMRAALRLEALGRDSVPLLKKGLESKDALVRFCSAESLAYLGNTAGIEDLAKLAIEYPDLRAYALIAIAGLDEAICRQKLGELMTVDDPELRSGAFRALRMIDENDSRLGESPLGPFSLHKVAGGSASLVTFATNRRAEIVVFGPEVSMTTPVKCLAGGEFTITAEPRDDRVTVSRFTVKGVQRKQCPLTLEDTLNAMIDLGAGYAEVIDLLRNLEEQKILSCQIREAVTPPVAGLEAILQADLKETKVNIVD